MVRLVDRRYTKYDGSLVGERACVDGPVGRLVNDIVDEDRKGLASWLHKHVRYAELEQRRRGLPVPVRERLRRFRARDRTDTRPLTRVLLKDLVFPLLPGQAAGAVPLHVRGAARPARRAGRAALLLLPRLVPGDRGRAAGGEPAAVPTRTVR